MKSIILLVAALFLAGFVLAGCSSSDNPNSNTTHLKFTIKHKDGHLEDIILPNAVPADATEAEMKAEINKYLSMQGLYEHSWQHDDVPTPLNRPASGNWCGCMGWPASPWESCMCGGGGCYCFAAGHAGSLAK